MPSDIQKRIIELRKKAKLSQEEVANALNIIRSTYASRETSSKNLTDEFINQLAVFYRVSTNFIRDGLVEKIPDTLRSPRSNENTKLPFIFTNSEKKMVEALRCLSVDRQLEIKKMISDEFKVITGIDEE